MTKHARASPELAQAQMMPAQDYRESERGREAGGEVSNRASRESEVRPAHNEACLATQMRSTGVMG